MATRMAGDAHHVHGLMQHASPYVALVGAHFHTADQSINVPEIRCARLYRLQGIAAADEFDLELAVVSPAVASMICKPAISATACN